MFSALRALDPFDDLRAVAGRVGRELAAVLANAPSAPSPGETAELEAHASALRAGADRFLEQHRLLVLPAASCDVPPAAGAPIPPEDLGPCRAISLPGLPAAAIAGVQLVGARDHDEDVLGAAQALEAIGVPA